MTIMSDESTASPDIPVLTEIVADDPISPSSPIELPSDMETLIAELQTRLSASAFALTEQLLHAAFSQMEAKLSKQVLSRLRQDLPELVDTILREHLGAETRED
jgi:hypothetical protein